MLHGSTAAVPLNKTCDVLTCHHNRWYEGKDRCILDDSESGGRHSCAVSGMHLVGNMGEAESWPGGGASQSTLTFVCVPVNKRDSQVKRENGLPGQRNAVLQGHTLMQAEGTGSVEQFGDKNVQCCV